MSLTQPSQQAQTAETAPPTSPPQTSPPPTSPRPEPTSPPPASPRPEPTSPPPARSGLGRERTKRDHSGSDRHRRAPVFPESCLRVRPWVDPLIDQLGHDPRSAYVEQYWLSILGPSSSWLVRRLVGHLERQPDGFDLNPTEWALELGLGARGGKHGPFWRAIERSCRFGATHRCGEALLVRRRLPPLTAGQINRLPDHLRCSHDEWVRQQLERPRRQTISQWSERHNQPRPGAQ